MKNFKISKFNLILISIFSIILVISIYDYTYYNKIVITNNQTSIENDFNSIKIYIHSDNKFIEKEIKLPISNHDEGDYINEIIKSYNFLDATHKFIASYNYNDSLIIKLSENFKKLPKEQFDDFVFSINKTLKENFNKINNIVIEIDSN